jgi:kynurenine formamidase
MISGCTPAKANDTSRILGFSPSSFTAVPPKVEGFGTFPVRAFAKLPE